MAEGDRADLNPGRPSRIRSCGPRGTALVPTDTSNPSSEYTAGDGMDASGGPGRIDTATSSTGGRKVAGSNPVAPTPGEQ